MSLKKDPVFRALYKIGLARIFPDEGFGSQRRFEDLKSKDFRNGFNELEAISPQISAVMLHRGFAASVFLRQSFRYKASFWVLYLTAGWQTRNHLRSPL